MGRGYVNSIDQQTHLDRSKQVPGEIIPHNPHSPRYANAMGLSAADTFDLRSLAPGARNLISAG